MDDATGTRRHRRCGAEQREEILRDAESLGVLEASRKHEVPQTT